MSRTTYERFDQVSLLTTRNIQFMVDIPGHMPDPQGIWQVVCCFPKTGKILVSKGTAICLVPVSDIARIANYDLEHVFKAVEKTNGQTREAGIGKGKETRKG